MDVLQNYRAHGTATCCASFHYLSLAWVNTGDFAAAIQIAPSRVPCTRPIWAHHAKAELLAPWVPAKFADCPTTPLQAGGRLGSRSFERLSRATMTRWQNRGPRPNGLPRTQRPRVPRTHKPIHQAMDARCHCRQGFIAGQEGSLQASRVPWPRLGQGILRRGLCRA